MKPSKTRTHIAWEAARLIRESPDLRHSDARRQAAARLCPAGALQRDLPTDEEIGQQLQAAVRAETRVEWGDRFEHYARLLRPLAGVRQDPDRHPEGDALYHSLQVFALAADRRSYDEELLTAALLHDIGKAIQRREPVAAGLTALDGLVTSRTAWFIENLSVAHDLAAGTLGVRARRRLELADDYDDLCLLAQCDRAGRKRGVTVPDIEEAIEQLQELSEL